MPLQVALKATPGTAEVNVKKHCASESATGAAHRKDFKEWSGFSNCNQHFLFIILKILCIYLKDTQGYCQNNSVSLETITFTS